MPYNNTLKNTDKEFYIEVARLLNVTPATAKRYWVDGFYEAIVRMTYRNGIFRFPIMGTITTTFEPEYYQEQVNPDDPKGEKVLYKVPARDKPHFTFNSDFVDDINNMAVTKAGRKRVRKNQLNSVDYRRMQRSAVLGDYGTLTPDRIEQANQDLLKKLQEKKDKIEEMEETE